jgi:hypothetical protein
MHVTVTSMTDTLVSSTHMLQSSAADRARARAESAEEFERMSHAMVEEKGLLNHAQAALLLDVSTKRVGELVRLGKLTDFEFLGRKYVSMREVWDRNKQDLKAGRPARPLAKRVKASLKAFGKTDFNQARLGGYAGPYQRQLVQERKAAAVEAKQKRREKYRAKWREIRKAHKK